MPSIPVSCDVMLDTSQKCKWHLIVSVIFKCVLYVESLSLQTGLILDKMRYRAEFEDGYMITKEQRSI